MEDNTDMILDASGDNKGNSEDLHEFSPCLFICQGRLITEYSLMGHQTMGRPTETETPDISVDYRFVSRKHGSFDTGNGRAFYNVEKTTNGIMYKGKLLEPGSRMELSDGDEFVIPCRQDKEEDSIIIVFASKEARINLWRTLQKASRDKLTALYGRDSFEIWWCQNCRKNDYAHAYLFILDIDDFKKINDSYGHTTGDAALRIVANELRLTVRYEYQVCRWGGDEFVGIIPGNREQAKERLNDLKERISKVSQEAGVPLSVSMGCVDVYCTGNVYDIDGILKKADEALYSSKRTGKGRVSFNP